MAFEIMTKSYSLPVGNVMVKIHYDRTWTPYYLDFHLTDQDDQLTLSYGYEDEDQLTFYPNVSKFVFEDHDRKNFDVLKYSLGEYARLEPSNRFQYGGVEVSLNGQLKFKGYIDELTLEYDEDNLTTSFEALDLTAMLSELIVDRQKIVNIIGEFTRLPLSTFIYAIYRQIWSDFGIGVYDVSLINSGLGGLFIKHDWRFTGRRINPFDERTKDWSIPVQFQQTIFNLDTTTLFNDDRPGRTWADFLRILALQFAVTIGTEDYGKVYFVKRFGFAGRTPVDISNMVVGNELSVRLHLPVLKGVHVINTWNGVRIYNYGTVEQESNGSFVYPNLVKVINTYVGSFTEGNITGTAIYVDNGNYPVLNGVRDPDLGVSGFHAYQVTGQWYLKARIRPKSLVEFTADGINYSMTGLYKVTPPDTNDISTIFRPMTLEKSYTTAQTRIVGVEI